MAKAASRRSTNRSRNWCCSDSEEAQLQCFRCGADDYVSKPFDPRSMTARVIAHLRRVYRYDVEETKTTPIPAGWLRCESCRYKGPAAEFDDINSMGMSITACPKCGKRVQPQITQMG
jgi:hypothetical protein